jgi:hypothetical protein
MKNLNDFDHGVGNYAPSETITSQPKENNWYEDLGEKLEPRLCFISENLCEGSKKSFHKGNEALCCNLFKDHRYPKTNIVLNCVFSSRLLDGFVRCVSGIATSVSEIPCAFCLLACTAVETKACCKACCD